MGKILLLAAGIAIGYTIGFRDARSHEESVVSRGVEHVRSSLGKGVGNNIDSVMNRVEGKK